MTALRCIGSCLPSFVMAIVFDIIGVVLLFVGIFGDVRMNGVLYGDFLIHTGALVLFASLALWLVWYVGNIRVKDEGLESRSSAAHSVKELARRLTKRLSRTHLKDNTGEKTGSKASTVRNVTWGKSTYFPGLQDLESDMIKCDELSKEKPDDDQFMCYQNQGYEDEESCKPIQEESVDQTQSEDSSESDRNQETKSGDDHFTCYQNETYEESESKSAATKDGEKPQEEKPDDQPESTEDLM
ncbi:uncharacterized protein tmem238l [Carassius auratus]|uniref:Uncharacterized protein tmem238l n=1 Tax=Carassius auratus TaxID=7957 RepID=A0A6P6KZ90_CARAU|nr:uncharacterized protein LOC113055469 [Carassius auratus]XP_052393152.1 uncharacterized protein LOC127941787 [Carassius gibelio]XP_052393167.1 uncharacterized protein LOC127941787 [Carassius gibelio]XP_052393176.1 uncharacterized protein LOC127941787 [Carassius gibelio]